MLKLERLLAKKQLKPIFKIGQLATGKSLINVKSHISTATRVSTIRVDKNRLCCVQLTFFHTDVTARKKTVDVVDEYDEKKSLMYYEEFQRYQKKDKKAFSQLVRVYKNNVKNRASHVDFIKAALKHMKEFGVHRDIDSYKKLLDVFPKGVYVCTNKLLADGMYFPRQQFVTIELLDQMSYYGVAPDVEFGTILVNVFGKKSHLYRMFAQQLYWTCKWKFKSPFVIPNPLPSDPSELAKIAIERITSVDLQTEISVFQTEDIEESIDKTWIVSGQSPKQKELLKKHPKNTPVIVEGGDVVFLGEHYLNYFVLKADGEPLPFVFKDINDISNIQSKFFNPEYVVKDEEPTVHEQDDGIIYAVCATGTSSRDSLLSWIRTLEKTGNSVLSDVPVLFRFKQEERLPSVTGELVQKNQ